MAVKYDRFGIQFLYPENWEIADDPTSEQTRSVLVLSPSGAFWSVDLCPRALNSHGAADQVLDTMRQEYADLEALPVTDQVGGLEATGYDMQFYCMDLIITAQVRAVSTEERTMVLLCQGEDRDFQRLEPVFRAMSESIFRRDPQTSSNR